MKKTLILSALLLGLLIVNNAFAITVDGNAYLENQSNHNGIKILFERIVPSSLIDSTFTDSSGYYSKEIEVGIYYITYSKDYFHTYYLYDQILYSNITLSDITLTESPCILNVPSVSYPTIQSAIEEAYTGDTVLVDTGRYYENINFIGKNITVSSLFLTIGDTTYISQTVIDGNNNGHVVEFSSEEDSSAILTGFTIINGNATNGGGIYCRNNSSPSLENVTIKSNHASSKGGGIFCYDILGNNSSPILRDVIVYNNFSSNNGGGIYISQHCWPHLNNVNINGNHANGNGGGIYGTLIANRLNNVIICGNSANGSGGGIYNDLSNTIAYGGSFSNVIINGNNAGVNGGGIYFDIYQLHHGFWLSNITISGNSANNSGGGIYFDQISGFLNENFNLTNCTISNNTVNNCGGGIFSYDNSNLNLNIVNSIVSNNNGSYGIFVLTGDPPSISFSDFWNNEEGNLNIFIQWLFVNVTTNANGDSCDAWYNIQLDPCFVDTSSGDYHLMSNSPCIDAGDPSTNVPDNGGWIVDMGAYEYTGTQIVRSVNGTGEILFGGQVKSKVNVINQGTLSEIDITVHPGETHTGAPNSVSRWYEITPTGSGATFDITLSYKDSELNGEVEDNLNMWRWTGSSWDGPKYPSERNTSENWLKVTNQNSFSNWVISDAEDEGTLPVELSSFNAVYTVNESGNEFVTVKWVTASETDLHGFNIYRSESNNFNYVGNHINTSLILGSGNTSQTQYYSFIDDIANPYKTYNYWLETVDFGGISEYYGPVKYIPGDIDGDQEVDLYSSTILYNNYPNPAINKTIIKYQMKGSILNQDAIISIYNIKGELLKAIEVKKGKAEFDVSDFTTGIYFYQIKTENYNEVKKMIILH